jgi:DNA gyrase subunit B
MYVGGLGSRGLERLVSTTVRRFLEASDEAGGAIRVRLHADGSVTVADVEGRSAPVMPIEVTRLPPDSASAENGDDRARLVVVNALSERFQLEQWVNGVPERCSFRRGQPHRGRPRRIRGVDGATIIHFRPDAEVFGDSVLSFDTLAEALEVMAAGSGATRICLEDDRSGRRREIQG